MQSREWLAGLFDQIRRQPLMKMTTELMASITKWRRQTRNSELLAILDAAEAGLRPAAKRGAPKRDRAAYMR